MTSLAQMLADGLHKQEQTPDAAQQLKLIQFIELLNKWNKVYNLTSVRKPEQMISRHLLDSLVMLPFFTGVDSGSPIKRVLDVGTGGGIPGIPLAICLPDIDFVLMDARGKKIRFIQTVIAQLGLKNITAVHSRVEQYSLAGEPGFERIISRAFASLADMLTYCQHLIAEQGVFLAMKGQIPEEEIAQLPEGFKIAGINQLDVAGLNAQRHLIQITFS